MCRKSSECLRQPLENWEELHEHPRAEGPFRIGSSSRLAGASFLVGFDGIRHSPHLCKRRHGYGGHMVECLHLWPLPAHRSEEHTSELQSLMRISYAVFCLKKKTTHNNTTRHKNENNNHTHNPYCT